MTSTRKSLIGKGPKRLSHAYSAAFADFLLLKEQI